MSWPLVRSDSTGAGGGQVELGDLQGSEYVFDEPSNRFSARRWYAGESVEPTGALSVVSDRVERLRFRYFDGRRWQSSFNSESQPCSLTSIRTSIGLR